jgi:hypothetical protein
MAMAREKDSLVAFKRRHDFKNINFQRLDVIPLVVRAWDVSFARTDKNRNAFIERGWYHLDRRLLNDPEILCTRVINSNTAPPPNHTVVINTASIDTEDSSAQEQQDIAQVIDVTEEARINTEESSAQEQQEIPQVIDVTEEASQVSRFSSLSALDELNLNFVNGIAGEMTQDLLALLLRKHKIHEAFVKRKEEGQRVRTRLATALKETRLTGGALFKIRQIVLDDEVLDLRKERDAAIRDGKKEVVIKLVDKYNKRLEKYQAVIATTKQEQEYTVPELKAWLAVQKKKVEGAMPTTLAALKAMYEKLKDQEPLTPIIPYDY